MAAAQYANLVEMQEKSCTRFANNRLFGTKTGGEYKWMTYAEFARQVDAFRAALSALGVVRGSKVAIIANNRVEWAVCAYSTYGLGAHYVPMYEAQLDKDWKYILNDSEAVVLIVSSEAIYEKTRGFVGTVGKLAHVVALDADASKPYSYAAQMKTGESAPVASVQPDSAETAGLIYTSGTTGQPKGVVLSHGNIVSNINAVHDIFPMTEEDVSCSFLPWAHSFGQTVELHVLLSMGAGIGIAESVNTLLDNFLEVKPTVLFAVPRIFNRIYDGVNNKMAQEKPIKRMLFGRALKVAKERRLLADQGKRSAWVDVQHRLFDKLVFSKIRARFGGRLRYAFSGGAALAREVGEFVDDIGVLVFEGYGLTETSPIATANTPAGRRIGTIGKAIPGVEIYICDEEGHVLPPDTDGEIVVVGPNVMQGYHNHPEETAQVIFNLNGKRAFKTGDMGQMGRDGFIRITGRFKEQYKLENGKYVVPTPLEDHLKLSPLVSQAFIYGDNRLYNVVLVVPDFDVLGRWAKENGIEAASNADLVKHPAVHKRIGDDLDKFSGEFKSYEKPRKWAVIEEEFTTANDLLTPKLSVKRRNVVKRYADLIESLYTES